MCVIQVSSLMQIAAHPRFLWAYICIALCFDKAWIDDNSMEEKDRLAP